MEPMNPVLHKNTNIAGPNMTKAEAGAEAAELPGSGAFSDAFLRAAGVVMGARAFYDAGVRTVAAARALRQTRRAGMILSMNTPLFPPQPQPAPQPAHQSSPAPPAPGASRFRGLVIAAFIGVAAAAVLGGLWTAAWHMLSGAALENAEAWLETQTDADAKARIACPALTAAGFPLHIGLRCERPSVTFANGARWRGPPVNLRAALWRPARWRAAWSGRHRITGADGAETVFTAQALSGLFDASKGGERFEINITGAAGESGPVQGWRLESARLGAAREGAESVNFEFRVGGAVAPKHLTAGAQLGRRIERLNIAGEISGPLNAGRWPPGAACLAEWRDSGGVFEFNEISAAFGALVLEGGGTMALDALLQPQGAFSLRVSGYEETLTALAGRGVMEPGEAAMAGFILNAMAKKPDGGGPPYVAAPVSIQESAVSIGPLKVGTLPRLRWPE